MRANHCCPSAKPLAPRGFGSPPVQVIGQDYHIVRIAMRAPGAIVRKLS